MRQIVLIIRQLSNPAKNDGIELQSLAAMSAKQHNLIGLWVIGTLVSSRLQAATGYAGRFKGALIAAASAGVSNELDSVWGGNTDPATGRTIPHDLSSWEGTGRFAGQRASQALADAGVQSAISGGSLNDNLKQNLQGAVTTVLEASLFNLVGDLTKQGAKGSNGQHWADGSAEKTVVHVLAGGLASQATGGDFRTGAIAAGANEALINQLDGLVKGDRRLLIVASQITGIVAAGMTDGDVQKGAEIAGNATAYNRMMHTSEREWIEAHGGSEEEKARLITAACALIECSAQYERGSEQYALYKGLEDKGNTDAFAAERQKVMSSGLFGYSKWNGVTDGLERYQVGNRSFGALQIVGSGALAASAAAMASTGAGSVLAYVLTGIAADQGAAGAMAVWYGHPAPTFGARVLADQMNIPVERAELLYGLATAAGEASAANQLLNAASRSVGKKPMVEFDGFDDGINASKPSPSAASGGKVGTDSLDNAVKNGTKVGELTFGSNGRKLDFLFNRNIDQSIPYNAGRAEGNARRIGIADTPDNRAEVTRLFNEAFNNPASVVGADKLPGSNMREFFLPGVTGTGSKIQFVEQNGKVITIMAR
ncbi:hypothetical protein GCM10010082_27880 [Kushneria pakistanensis]|uniref:DUF637 domain-containing protein n=1 Tax=Kushneria pakistanensis TaxID=1508770 RepID=A0ABQ3FPA8_9GAMM|nr:DUF637 domain-containing protein [Kushneria pakistanensis]GHC31988.1 hypothetical protein GCM10010082_27880 [Kushneria pakistanensis]